MLTEESLESAQRSVIESRAMDLEGARITRGNLRDVEKCPGALVVGATTDGCPRAPLFLVLVSLAEPVGALSAVQVHTFEADSRGKVGKITTYFMEKKNGSWVLARRGLTTIIE